MTAAKVAVKQMAQKILPEKTYRRLADKLRGNAEQQDPTLSLRQAIEKDTLSDESLLNLKNTIEIKRRMDYGPHDIYLHVDSLTEFETRLHSCAKEPDTVEWVETFMKPGDTFYDIGANVGAYSLIAAKAFHGAVKVFAFEPAFLNFSQLCRNVFLNDCQDSITPLSIALSDKTSLDSFNYHDLIPGGSLHTLGEAIDYKGDRFKPVFKQAMLSFTTDDLIAQFALPTPTHIKIDVDGIELSILKGAELTLSDKTLRSIVVELEEGQSEEQINSLLFQKGFRLHARYGRRTAGMFNCIFVRP
ncbi:MAG TPA: FkbM family methyltransferase [Pyrinomonadaceae bacterium]|jgi:FkbM family methyltransferase